MSRSVNGGTSSWYIYSSSTLSFHNLKVLLNSLAKFKGCYSPINNTEYCLGRKERRYTTHWNNNFMHNSSVRCCKKNDIYICLFNSRVLKLKESYKGIGGLLCVRKFWKKLMLRNSQTLLKSSCIYTIYLYTMLFYSWECIFRFQISSSKKISVWYIRDLNR